MIYLESFRLASEYNETEYCFKSRKLDMTAHNVNRKGAGRAGLPLWDGTGKDQPTFSTSARA